MGKLIAIVAAGLAALAFSRRKTLKEDTERAKALATEQASALNARVRGASKEAEDTVIDLSEDTPAEAEAAGETAEEEAAAEQEATDAP
ncbi:MAG: hypothetical protein ACN4GZ_06510 [Acidimicrobiales bacterium]